MSKIIGIHQPNLFPWLGYFAKIAKSDAFVFLDHVVLNPRTSIYTKRVKILSNKEEFWLTVPLKNKAGQTFLPINEMEIDNPKFVGDKQLKTIELNYKKSPFFSEAFPFVQAFYSSPTPFIAERNIAFITSLCEAFGWKKEFHISSAMDCQNSSTELLVEIVKKCEGSAYLSGDGAEGYQENELYAQNGLGLSFMNFAHPTYAQPNAKTFTKGLSVLDALMNLGVQGTKELLLLSLPHA